MKTLQIENTFIGQLTTENYFSTYQEAIQELHSSINSEWNWMLDELPKSKFTIGYYHNEKFVVVYSLTVPKIKSLKKLNLF